MGEEQEGRSWFQMYGGMVPEKIVDTKIGEDGRRYYKVKWASTTIESSRNFLEAEQLIEKYWDPVQKKLKMPQQDGSGPSTSSSGASTNQDFSEVQLLSEVAQNVSHTQEELSTQDALTNLDVLNTPVALTSQDVFTTQAALSSEDVLSSQNVIASQGVLANETEENVETQQADDETLVYLNNGELVSLNGYTLQMLLNQANNLSEVVVDNPVEYVEQIENVDGFVENSQTLVLGDSAPVSFQTNENVDGFVENSRTFAENSTTSLQSDENVSENPVAENAANSFQSNENLNDVVSTTLKGTVANEEDCPQEKRKKV